MRRAGAKAEEQQTREAIAAALAARGLRATRQRIEILRALRGHPGHPTASELHRTLRRKLRRLGLKTVYSALESLVDAGLVACVVEGGSPYRYEARAEPHYHARCRSCGQLFDLRAAADGAILGRSRLPEGFRAERVSVTIVGRCARCRESV